MMRQRLSFQDLLLVGFTLFSMFFGAGNLIFPPFLGAQAGSLTWKAMGGFLVSAVGLPVLGVAAVALSGGLSRLAGRVGPRFSCFFTLIVYLSVGPCLAIPRTAGTSFEMTVLPVLMDLGLSLGKQAGGSGISIYTLAIFVYSLIFFAAAMFLSLRPEKLSDRLGKILCPTLLVLIAVIFLGCLVWPMGRYGTPSELYSAGPGVRGFLEGYQTMDTLAALNFGIIIAMNIQVRGVTAESDVVRETIKAGIVAGVLLTVIYCALAHIGAPVGAAAGRDANGARILTYVAWNLFGKAGRAILGLIFLIACFNTCVGLISSCSQYFSTVIPALSYGMWVVFFASVSLLISCAGLDSILRISLPVLAAVYPVAIVLILLAFLDHFFEGKTSVYFWAILFTACVSAVYALEQAGVLVPGLSLAAGWLPGYQAGLGWIVPALAGTALGLVLPEGVFDGLL